MNILKEVLRHEVYPALGCTEPTAVAYAASIAADAIGGEYQFMTIKVDPGIYKNGMAVTVPRTDGEHGNLIAGVLGALIAEPNRKMQILDGTTNEKLKQAKEIVASRQASVELIPVHSDLYIEINLKTTSGTARAIVAHEHTGLVFLETNGTILLNEDGGGKTKPRSYREILRSKSIADLVDSISEIDAEEMAYLKEGVRMNCSISEAGVHLKKVGYYLSDLMEKGLLQDDIFSSSKIMTASASDARMAGLNYPVMASGGSGNQGIVATLVPYNVGKHFRIDEDTILRSIALSHLMNSYIKCFTGDLSPLCGCAIAAGVGAAVAIVYQQRGKDMEKIALAVNNLISDLGGMLCDGAKSGCALKVVSSTDSAIRSAYMALNGHGITSIEGFVGRTAEETILNLSKISAIGMEKADDIMLGIMMDKQK